MVKLGFSVVAPISVMMPFSTKGSSVSCWDLFRRWISSRKTSVGVPYFWLSSAFLMISVRSSFLLLTPESWKKSAWILRAIISASVVFPQPGGPRNRSEGIFFMFQKSRNRLAFADQMWLSDEGFKRLRAKKRRKGFHRLLLMIKRGRFHHSHYSQKFKRENSSCFCIGNLYLRISFLYSYLQLWKKFESWLRWQKRLSIS